MRDRKGMNGNTIDSERPAALDSTHLFYPAQVSGRRPMGSRCHINRQVKTARDRTDSTDMIIMFMGYYNTAQRIWRSPDSI
jgi:hypothetical protein